MTKRGPGLLCLIALLLACAGCRREGGALTIQPAPTASQAFSSDEYEARRARILEEISGLSGFHAWAGSFVGNLATDRTDHLDLSPSGQFVFSSKSVGGVYNRAYGTSKALSGPDRIALTTESLEGTSKRHLPSEFVIVPWGDRCYLIPEADLVSFCNNVNGGSEAARESGRFFHRGDHGPIAGRPTLPAPYADYVLEAPLIATIVEVLDRFPPSTESRWIKARIVVDKGTRDGVFTGMRMRLLHSEAYCAATVNRASELTSEVVISCDRTLDSVVVGGILSARP